MNGLPFAPCTETRCVPRRPRCLAPPPPQGAVPRLHTLLLTVRTPDLLALLPLPDDLPMCQSWKERGCWMQFSQCGQVHITNLLPLAGPAGWGFKKKGTSVSPEYAVPLNDIPASQLDRASHTPGSQSSLMLSWIPGVLVNGTGEQPLSPSCWLRLSSCKGRAAEKVGPPWGSQNPHL